MTIQQLQDSNLSLKWATSQCKNILWKSFKLSGWKINVVCRIILRILTKHFLTWIKSNQFYWYISRSQSHRLSGLYNLYGELHPPHQIMIKFKWIIMLHGLFKHIELTDINLSFLCQYQITQIFYKHIYLESSLLGEL